jgi:membrane protein
MMQRIHHVPKHLAKWRDGLLQDEHTLRYRWYVVLKRVLPIFWRGVFENSLFSRASALSYSSLLALAPILGIFVILSGSFLRVNAEDHVKQALFLIAPSLEEYVNTDDASNVVHAAPAATQDGSPAQPALQGSKKAREMDHALDLLISHMIQGVRENLNGISKSGKSVASVIGGLVLIWMGITLLVAIENAMNNIWGVKSGRAWGKKVVLYWALLCLGILAALVLVGLTSASTLGKLLGSMPFGSELVKHTTSIGAVFAGVSLTLILTFFYKFFPNTRVRFRPALVGGLVAASLLVANKVLSTMYINRVIAIQSLFGSMGIILVLMFGLYLFWAFLLLGGQLTYAVQNAQFLADRKAWAHASTRAKEMIALSSLVLISRRFTKCEPPLSSDEIAESMRVPANVLNEALSKLCEMGFITALESNSPERKGSDRMCFTLVRPVGSINFANFHNAYMALGEDRGVDELRKEDPIVDLFWNRMGAAVASMPDESVESLLAKAGDEKTEENV